VPSPPYIRHFLFKLMSTYTQQNVLKCLFEALSGLDLLRSRTITTIFLYTFVDRWLVTTRCFLIKQLPAVMLDDVG